MGFFGRIYNLWKGFLSLFVGNMEEKHPEIAYENAINSMTEKYTKLKTASAGLIKNRTRIENAMQKNHKELEEIELQVQMAVDAGDDELATVLLERQEELETAIANDQADLDQAVKDAESAKASLSSLKVEIDKLKREKDKTVAQIQDAEARKQIQDQLEGLSVDDDIKALTGVREHAEKLRAEVKINEELKEDSVEGRLAALKAKTGSAKASSRLAALKAAKAAKEGAAAPTVKEL